MKHGPVCHWADACSTKCMQALFCAATKMSLQGPRRPVMSPVLRISLQAFC